MSTTHTTQSPRSLLSRAAAVRRVPFSLSALIVMWVLHWAVSRHSLALSMDYAADRWHLLSAGLTSGSRVGLIFASLAVIAMIIPAERTLGTARTMAVAAVTHLCSTAAGLLAVRLVAETGFHRWGSDLLHASFLSPVSWLFGTAAYASTAMPLLWRRRLAVWLVALCSTLVLFSGSVSDVVGLVSALLGLVAGTVRHGRPRLRVGSVQEARVLVSTFLAAVSFGPLVASTHPGSGSPLAFVGALTWLPARRSYEAALVCQGNVGTQRCHEAVLLAQQSGVEPSVANLMPLVLNLVIIAGLLKGRRAAWWLALVAQSMVVVALCAQVWANYRAESVAVLAWYALPMALPWLGGIVLLLGTRRHFQVTIAARNIRRCLGVIAAALALTSVAWLLGASLMGVSWPVVLREWPLRYLPPSLAPLFPMSLVPEHPAAWVLYSWLGAIFNLVAALALYRLLMSVPDEHAEEERARARGLLRHGDHLQAMTLWEGNRYWFGEHEGVAGYVAYRVRRGIAVTVGEPVGTPGLAAGFEAFAASQGWTVAWYSVREGFADTLPGYQRIHVAEESVLSTEKVEFRGKKFQNVRTARNRAEKEGITARWTTWAEADVVLRQRIVELSEEWLADKPLPEMGFTLGTITELGAPGTRLLVVEGESGHLHAVTSWLPVYEHGALVGLTLDFMRRDTGGFKSAMEFALSQALLDAAAEGLKWVSLSGAPLARSTPAEGFVDQALDRVGASMEPFYGFRSLAASKYKFHPEYHPWYVACRDELALPKVALAVSQCYLPQLRATEAARLLRVWLSAALVRGGRGESS
ncbi:MULTISPECIES: DUF2156 domain-containing protein [unclassified Corynebacterium]|uniref:bifunctional lysylphosphatidylglycerol flippase/synthetase MprF n=1 Tax=unclassified Corynebacterium TaxID=2624378 RepID=UPI0029C9B3C9|nr:MULTISPECIES: DUF2156 domain-containing protein [unclassified Corynebacterium]WPF67030.1 DUF2156 domain-containing protein [Corynebacterium sp. 22KM0430]WPF69518.1 DUF2156 domain-containing protein [Corynebacterium sp. 21KM1197]